MNKILIIGTTRKIVLDQNIYKIYSYFKHKNKKFEITLLTSDSEYVNNHVDNYVRLNEKFINENTELLEEKYDIYFVCHMSKKFLEYLNIYSYLLKNHIFDIYLIFNDNTIMKRSLSNIKKYHIIFLYIIKKIYGKFLIRI